MALVVVVLGPRQVAPTLGPDIVRKLVRIGITDVSLVDGVGGSALVLSGWSFDGRRHEARVLELVAPDSGASVLHGIADVTLRPEHMRQLSPDGLFTNGRNS